MSERVVGFGADGRRLRKAQYNGSRHRFLRAALAPRVAVVGADCAICGMRIAAGSAWDLAHAADRRFYLGPAHVRCNRATALPSGDPLGSRSQQW